MNQTVVLISGEYLARAFVYRYDLTLTLLSIPRGIDCLDSNQVLSYERELCIVKN
jgi:hypothetical protein